MNESAVNDLKKRYEALSARKEELQAKRDRILGKKEVAEKALQEKEEECRSKGIDPDNIDEVLEGLVSKYRDHLDMISEAYDFASTKLSEMEDQ